MQVINGPPPERGKCVFCGKPVGQSAYGAHTSGGAYVVWTPAEVASDPRSAGARLGRACSACGMRPDYAEYIVPMDPIAVPALSYTLGDATAPQGPGPHIIAHVCNDQGGWGAGFVLALSAKWQSPALLYRRWAQGVDLTEADVPFGLGNVQFVPVGPDLYVANMIAQHGFGPDAQGNPALRYDALEACLRLVADEARSLGATIHMPRIGAGLGGGNWDQIEIIIATACAGVPVTVYDLPTGVRPASYVPTDRPTRRGEALGRGRDTEVYDTNYGTDYRDLDRRYTQFDRNTRPPPPPLGNRHRTGAAAQAHAEREKEQYNFFADPLWDDLDGPTPAQQERERKAARKRTPLPLKKKKGS